MCVCVCVCVRQREREFYLPSIDSGISFSSTSMDAADEKRNPIRANITIARKDFIVTLCAISNEELK